MTGWEPGGAGLLELPDGRLIRGRGLRAGTPADSPDVGLYLLSRRQRRRLDGFDWQWRQVDWPDFRAPASPMDAAEAIRQAWELTRERRVEIACGGGVGRTGTALACCAALSGLDPDEAIDYVRSAYRQRAVETRSQRRFVHWFSAAT